MVVLTILCILAWAGGIASGWDWLYWASIAFGSAQAIRTAVQALRRRELDINILMLLAGIGAVAIERYFDAATLFLLFSLSNTLEQYALGRTERGIASLIKLRPQTARRFNNAELETVRVEELKPGDLVQVDAFAQVPADGEVLAGNTSINEAIMTGESEPVPKLPGDNVMAGTQNLEGVLTVRVTAAAANSSIDRIIALVNEARENKSGYERISVWFGQSYTIGVMAAFVLSLLIRYALNPHDPGSAFFASLVLLVGLSPCALVISTPAAILAALATASRNGILVRGGAALEAAANIRAIAFDKTGTLTMGVFEVREVRLDGEVWLSGTPFPDRFINPMKMAAALESGSNHPLAVAICKCAAQFGTGLSAQDAVVVGGYGVEGKINGHPAKLGRKEFFEYLSEGTLSAVESLRERGLTFVIMQTNSIEMVIGLSDVVRTHARSAVDALRGLGVEHILLLTGDHREAAKAAADEANIQEIHAELLPGEKKQHIDRMKSEYGSVMMVGDGVNDAPSLASANVGIAFGGLGSDVAIGAADIVLVNDKLENIPVLISLARATGQIVKQNIGISLLSISVLALLSVIGKLPLTYAVLGHEGTTVVVILNALRLLREQKPSAA